MVNNSKICDFLLVFLLTFLSAIVKVFYLQIFVIFFAAIFLGGCGCNIRTDKKSIRQVEINQYQNIEKQATQLKNTEKKTDIENKGLKTQLLNDVTMSKFYNYNLKSSVQNEEVTIKNLEEALRMIRNSNLEAALRLVQRIELQHKSDPYILMQTSYLQAMIYHRLNQPAKRKEAMNNLLKFMEEMQSDERFQMGFLDGQDAQELIKLSLNKYEHKYKFKEE